MGQPLSNITLIPASAPPIGKTLSISQTAKEVGVCRRTVYNWLNRGLVEFKRLPSGSIRVFESSLWKEKLGGETQINT